MEYLRRGGCGDGLSAAARAGWTLRRQGLAGGARRSRKARKPSYVEGCIAAVYNTGIGWTTANVPKLSGKFVQTERATWRADVPAKSAERGKKICERGKK